jgi:hypothetical protein
MVETSCKTVAHFELALSARVLMGSFRLLGTPSIGRSLREARNPHNKGTAHLLFRFPFQKSRWQKYPSDP